MNGPPCAFRTHTILHLLTVVLPTNTLHTTHSPPPLSSFLTNLRKIPWALKSSTLGPFVSTRPHLNVLQLRDLHGSLCAKNTWGRNKDQDAADVERKKMPYGEDHSRGARIRHFFFLLSFIATSSVGKSPYRHLLFFSWRVVTRRPF